MTGSTWLAFWREHRDRMTHPDRVPPEAQSVDGETAWKQWEATRAGRNTGQPEPHRELPAGEQWWHHRFDAGFAQRFGPPARPPYEPRPTAADWARHRGREAEPA